MTQKDRHVVVTTGRSRVVLVIDTEGEALSEAEPVSSSRLRKAAPVASEFDELRAWREQATRARKGAA